MDKDTDEYRAERRKQERNLERLLLSRLQGEGREFSIEEVRLQLARRVKKSKKR